MKGTFVLGTMYPVMHVHVEEVPIELKDEFLESLTPGEIYLLEEFQKVVTETGEYLVSRWTDAGVLVQEIEGRTIVHKPTDD